MKMLFLLAAIVVGLVAVGVIHFQKNGDNINVSIDENKLRQTTAKVIREGEQIVNQAEQSIQQDDKSAARSRSADRKRRQRRGASSGAADAAVSGAVAETAVAPHCGADEVVQEAVTGRLAPARFR